MPPKGDDTWRIPSKLAITVIGVLLSGAMTFNVWAVTSVYARPTRQEVTEMILDKSPYVADRAMILRAVDEAAVNYKELKIVIQRQTEAVIELQTVIKNL